MHGMWWRGMCGGRGVGWGTCMVGGFCGVHGQGMHGGGHVWWWGVCMVGGAWQGACMAVGMHGWGTCMAGGHAWRGTCMVGGMHATADTTGMHSYITVIYTILPDLTEQGTEQNTRLFFSAETLKS